MAVDVILPQIGFSVTEGTVVEWLVADGGTVEQGAPLFSLESDKAVNEVEAPASGVLRILKEAGGLYPVGEVIAVIE